MLVSSSHWASVAVRLAGLSLPSGVQRGLLLPEAVPRVCSGVGALDALLGGGIPRGRICELRGPFSSGKTSLLVTLLAAATRRGEVVACVDAADALDPRSVAAAGADLHRLLWVRPPSFLDGVRCTELLLQAGGFALIGLDLGQQTPRSLRARVWPRLLRAAAGSRTALVVLAPQRIAGSFAALSLGLRPGRVLWRGGLWPLFDGFRSTVRIERNKLGLSEAQGVELRVESGGSEAALSTFDFSR